MSAIQNIYSYLDEHDLDMIKNIKLFFREYDRYKNEKKQGTASNNKKNLLKFINIKIFSKKYGNILNKHFGMQNDLNAYGELIDILGEKNIKNAISDQTLTTAQIADLLITNDKLEDFQNSCKNHFLINRMQEHIEFNRITGLDLNLFKENGVVPNKFARKCYGTHADDIYRQNNIMDIWKEKNISREDIKEIYEEYRDEIASLYNNDMSLRNQTVLMTDEKYKDTFASGGLQDHVTYYSEEDFKEIFDKYIKGEELKENENYILMGLLTKTTDLIALYPSGLLKQNPDLVKSEIKLGIVEDIVSDNKEYTNDEREKLVTLNERWNSEDLHRYNNLSLLKERLKPLYKSEEQLMEIAFIEDIISKPLEEIAIQADVIADYMESVYTEYEIENRENLIENLYDPREKVIVIDDLTKMESAAMLHFFKPAKKISKFDAYIKKIEEENQLEGNNHVFSDDEIEAMKLQYEAKENHFITDYALDLEGIGQVGSFDERYVTNTSNQLSAMVVTPQTILEGEKIRGNIALGFSKKTLDSELITTISDENIHSNKGIDYVESANSFEDFSASYDELISDNQRGNNEIVLFRNSYQTSLKPSYVMYISNQGASNENDYIESIEKQMQEAGLDIPLVIFDRELIKENEKEKENKQIEDQKMANEERTNEEIVNEDITYEEILNKEIENIDQEIESLNKEIENLNKEIENDDFSL